MYQIICVNEPGSAPVAETYQTYSQADGAWMEAREACRLAPGDSVLLFFACRQEGMTLERMEAF